MAENLPQKTGGSNWSISLQLVKVVCCVIAGTLLVPVSTTPTQLTPPPRGSQTPQPHSTAILGFEPVHMSTAIRGVPHHAMHKFISIISTCHYMIQCEFSHYSQHAYNQHQHILRHTRVYCFDKSNMWTLQYLHISICFRDIDHLSGEAHMLRHTHGRGRHTTDYTNA